MKGIYIIAIVFLASWTVITANKDFDQDQPDLRDKILTRCPYPEKDNHTTTNLPHESNCELFYKCFLGEGVKQKCPKMDKNNPRKRLHYNRQEQVCDWPWRAGCVTCLEKDKKGRCFEFKISNPKDKCNSYYQCTKDCKKVPKRCPSGTCFSRTCQACVKKGIWKGGHCDEPCDDLRQGDRKIHEYDCGLYHECLNKSWILKKCNAGLHFNIETKECGLPNIAKCPYISN